MEDKRSLITMGLKPLLMDESLSARVKMSICQLCVALADHGYVHPLAGGQHVIQFLLTNLVLKPEAIMSSKKQSTVSPMSTESVSLNQLHLQCAQALHTIANTCESAYTLLWPLLFEYICVEAYTPVIADLFKCLRILTERAREAGQKLDFVTDFDTSPRIAGPLQVMARIFVCMNGAPLTTSLLNRALESLKVLDEISIWFNEAIPAVLQEQLPQMLAILEEEGPASTDHLPPSTRTEPTGQQPRFGQKKSRSADYSTLELRCARSLRWQADILELMNSCICVVNSGEWRQALAAAQAKQLQLYNDNSHDKAFLMRCLGWTLSRITNCNFVVDHMELLFRSTTHSNQIERVGCAMAMGHCAQSHTDLILTELENVAKWEHTKDWNKKNSGSGGIFNMLKEAMPYGKTLDLEVIHLRATLVLSYGYVVYYCPIEMVVQRLEQTVLPFLRQYIANCKEIVMKEAHLETINLIAITVHSSHLNSDYEFKNRYECFSYIKQYVQSESPETLSSWIRLLAAKATASLVQLDPPISQNELVDVGSVLTNQVFPMGREKSGLKTLDPLSVTGFLLPPVLSSSSSSRLSMLSVCSSAAVLHHQRSFTAATSTANAESVAQPSSKSKKEEKQRSKAAAKAEANGDSSGGSSIGSRQHNRIDDDEASTVMDATVMQYRNAISHIVTRQPFVDPVYILLRMFFEYFVSPVDHERARAIDSTVLVLHVYAENAADCVLGHANDFHPLSNLLGRLCPRLADSYYAVRILSIRAIWLSFKLSLLRRGHSPQDTDLVDSALFDVPSFIDEYLGNEGKMDPIKCRSVIIAISKEVEKRLPQSQVQVYLSVLLKMLDDKQSHVSSSAAQLLSIIVADRGHLLHAEAEKLISTLLENLSKHLAIQTYTELQNAFNLFSAHQQFVAIDVLLRQPLPYSTTNSDVWQMMARDTTQFTVAVDYILDLLGAGQQPSLQSQHASPTPNAQLEDSGATQEEVSPEQPTRSPLHSPTSNPPQPKQHYEIIDVGGGAAVKVVCSEVCALTAALQELIKSGEPEDALFARIPSIIAALLQVLSAVVDTQFPTVQKPAVTVPVPSSGATPSSTSKSGAPKASKKMPSVPIITSELCRVASTPANLVSQALKTLLLRIRAEPVIETMNSERAWTNITHPQHYIATISILCRSLCDHRPKFVGSLMCIMAARIDSICEAERVAAVAVLSSLVTRCPKENGEFDAALLDVVVQALGKALKDPKLIVRKLAIRGHGLIGQLGVSLAAKLTDPLYSKEDLIEKYSKRAVDAALVGLDDSGDRSDQLAIEAVDALDSLVAVAESKLLVHILPQLLLKIRPCFEKENPPLRAAAFSLFAGLGARVGDCEAFKESLHNNIVSVLLHLNDTDENVQQKSAHVLRSTSKLLNSDHAMNLVEREVVGQKPIQNYPAFLKDFSLILAVSFPDRVNYYALNCANYFKSQSPRIRQNAALMTGFLLAALRLVQLLKDQDEEVRLTTARAISCLHAYA
uniref:Huntingtin n=1 Tax=Ditylenchus dipsaci TaxID=166011 RepID=A0A915CVK4_9BILA